MRKMRRGSWVLVFQSLIGLGLLVAWLLVVDTQSLLANLGAVKWRTIALAGALGVLSLSIRSVRWKQVLSPVANVPFPDLWAIGLASSLINFVIPVRSGELARGVFLKQRYAVRMSVSLPTVVLDRSLDLLAVVLIGIVGALGGLAIDRSISVVIGLGAALLIGFAAFVLFAILARQRLSMLIQRLIPKSLGQPLRERVIQVMEGFLVGFASVGTHPRMLLPLVGLSLLAALVDSAVFLVLFADLGAGIAPFAILVGYALFAITFVVPGAPGYIGSMEAFGSLVFGALGMQTAVAASGIVVYHALNAALLAIGGGLAFWLLGARPGSVWRSVTQAEPEAPSSL